MRLLYRADASRRIGTGHLWRAARLIQELSRQGPLEASLAVCEDDAALQIAAQAEAEIITLPPPAVPSAVKPEFNSSPLLPILRARAFDLVCVDMLDTPAESMRALAEAGVPIVTFDDRGPGRRFARGIVNVLVNEPAASSLPPEMELREGGDYAVLDPLYAGANGAYARQEFEGRVFVSLGGADAAGLCVKVARALKLADGVREVHFGIGAAFPHHRALMDEVSGARWERRIHAGLPNLLDRYLWCDLAIVAGGFTMYEVCCVGTPALAVCQPIDHQYELAERLSAAGGMRTAGYGEQASESRIAEMVSGLLRDDSARRAMTVNGPRLVDGRGTERVAGILRRIAAA